MTPARLPGRRSVSGETFAGQWTDLIRRAGKEPIGLDISDYSDEFCAGFLAGQESILEEIEAGRLTLPRAEAESS